VDATCLGLVWVSSSHACFLQLCSGSLASSLIRSLSLLRLFVAAKRAAEADSGSVEPEEAEYGAEGLGEFSLSSTADTAELLLLLKRRPSPVVILAGGAVTTRDAAAMALALSSSA
jgi:hypothetical protein